MDLLARKPVARMANQLIRFFLEKNFNITILDEKLRPVSDCRNVIAKNCERMSQISLFQETDVQTTCPDGCKGRTTMVPCYHLEVFPEQIFVLHETEDFNFRLIPKPLRPDETVFRSSSMQTSHFYNIYKALYPIVFSS